MLMWRVVDWEGEVLDVLVQKLRGKEAAVKVLDCIDRYRPGRLRNNNRVENSHLPVRRRARTMQRLKSQGQDQRFASTHSATYNAFNTQRHVVSRNTLRKFRTAASAAQE